MDPLSTDVGCFFAGVMAIVAGKLFCCPACYEIRDGKARFRGCVPLIPNVLHFTSTQHLK